MPVYNDYRKKFDRLPEHILFSLASLIVFYRGKRGEEEIALKDDPENIKFFQELWNSSKDCNEIAKCALSNSELWGQNLADNDTVNLVAGYIKNIVENGERAALHKLFAKE